MFIIPQTITTEAAPSHIGLHLTNFTFMRFGMFEVMVWPMQ